MDNFFRWFLAILTILSSSPLWAKIYVVVWLIMTLGLVLIFIQLKVSTVNDRSAASPKVISINDGSQKIALPNSPGAVIYQAGGDIILTPQSSSSEVESIESLVVEGRLTCTQKSGTQLPPPKVEFLPVGGGFAELTGSGGSIRMQFISPVLFRRVDPDLTVIINRYEMRSSEVLVGRPSEQLKKYANLTLPFITVTFGDLFEKIRQLEVIVILNGNEKWYGCYEYDTDFLKGPSFQVSLSELHNKLK